MKRLNRHKGENKTTRRAAENAVLSDAHLPKTNSSGSKLPKVRVSGARLRKAKLPGSEIAQAPLPIARPTQAKRIHTGSARKKITHSVESGSKHLVNCGRCNGLLECSSHILCDVDEAREEFTLLCDHCQAELVLYGAARTEIDDILRQTDEGN